jgi:hypothetical protein
VIGDKPGPWAEAGFALDGDRLRIANTVLRFPGTADGRGILSVSADELQGPIDDMPFGGTEVNKVRSLPHRNQVTEFDHLVAMSPNMDRTTAALVAAGLDHRRTRTFEAGDRTMRQAFFWMGDVILELAGEDAAHGADPATLWGLALTCHDLHGAAAELGDALGAIKPAVQRGREIATLRTRELGISVPVALMSPHPRSGA